MAWNLPGERYDEIRETVADLLEDRGVNFYPFSLFDLIRNLGIRIYPYSMLPEDLLSELRNKDIAGFTKRPSSFNPLKTVMLIDYALPYERIRFTLAHELGHLYLEHPDTNAKIYEDEADFFANYLLGPNPLVIRYSISSVEEIMYYFQVSYPCACSIRDRSKKRLQHGGALREYEKRILDNCQLLKGGERIA